MNTESSRVNVILIDRIVDMYAVTDFASSCPLDKMNMLLDRFPKTSSDIAVITEPLLNDLQYVILFGNLSYLSSKLCLNHIYKFIRFF